MPGQRNTIFFVSQRRWKLALNRNQKGLFWFYIYFQQEVIHNLFLSGNSIQDEVSRSEIRKHSGRDYLKFQGFLSPQ